MEQNKNPYLPAGGQRPGSPILGEPVGVGVGMGVGVGGVGVGVGLFFV